MKKYSKENKLFMQGLLLNDLKVPTISRFLGITREPVTSLENDEMVTERSAKERISALSRTAYLFVRQIENSAENRDLLEQLVKLR